MTMLTPIKIIQDPQLGPAVSGRELFKLTTEPIAQRDTFTDRFRHSKSKLGLVEGKDYVETTALVPERHSTKRFLEFIVSLEAAKKLAAIQTKGRGKGVIAFIEAYELNTLSTNGQQKPVELLSPDSTVTHAEKQLELPLASLRQEEQPEPAAIPKSRSQQLLDEARKLTELAEEEARREAQQPVPSNEALDALDRRFNALEKKVNVVLYFFQQASFAVRSLGPVTLPVEPIDAPQPEPVAEAAPSAEPTTRMLLVRLVNSYAAADRKPEHDTWKWLYGQFDLRKGFNVYAQTGPEAKGKDESYLTVIEKHGRIDELYTLAKKLMTLPELR